MKILTRRIIENLEWIREMRLANGFDLGDIDAKIDRLRKELS